MKDNIDTVSDALHDTIIFSVEQNGPSNNITIRGRTADGEERKVTIRTQDANDILVAS